MHKTVEMAQLYPVIEEKFHAGGNVSLTTTGYSMLPMLHHQKDIVILGPITDIPHINDVVLYKRDSGVYVMHRIVGRDSDGDYILCGDNQFSWEHHIKRQQILGVLLAFSWKDHIISCSSLSYKAYVSVLPVIRLLKQGLSLGTLYKVALKRMLNR